MNEKGINHADINEVDSEIKEKSMGYWQEIKTSRRRLFENLKESSIFYHQLLSNSGEIGDVEKTDLNESLQEWKKQILPELKRWSVTLKESYVFLTKNGMSEYLDHDIVNESTKVIGGSEMSVVRMESPEIDANAFFRMLKVFLEAWERYWVAAEDILIRRIDEIAVPEECQVGIGIDSFKTVINCFENGDMKGIRAWSGDGNSTYFKSNKKNFVLEVDWQKLEKDLNGRKVKGNEGVLGNFLLNAFRNGFKVNIDSTNIFFCAEIVGDEMIIRVMDDGKGIDTDSLNPESGAFIFKKGSSKTGSTGLGLANFNKRLRSMGGELEVVSYRREEKKVNEYLADGEKGLDLDGFNKARWRDGKVPVKTIFEIRLPIIKKE